METAFGAAAQPGPPPAPISANELAWAAANAAGFAAAQSTLPAILLGPSEAGSQPNQSPQPLLGAFLLPFLALPWHLAGVTVLLLAKQALVLHPTALWLVKLLDRHDSGYLANACSEQCQEGGE